MQSSFAAAEKVMGRQSHLVSCPSPGTQAEGRVRVFFRTFAHEFPSPQPSPGVPGEGVRLPYAIGPGSIRGDGGVTPNVVMH